MQDDAPYTDTDAPVDDNVTHLPHTGTPPHAKAAEMALLGAILLNPAVYDQVHDEIEPADLYEPRHEIIWDTFTKLAAEDHLDPILITQQLIDDGNITKIGGAPYLHQLTETCPSEHRATEYAYIVREASRARHIATRARHVASLAERATPNTLHHAVAEALQEFDTLAARTGPRASTGVRYVPFNGLFTRPRQPIRWITAPILAAGRVTLLYSPGKTGKSLIAMEAAAAIATGRTALATHTPQNPQHVLYIDQEMTEDDWLDRLSDMGYNSDDEPLLAEHLHLAQFHAWPPMDTPAGGRAVETEAKRVGATTVIIDTASKVIAGEENANDTQQAFYRNTLIPLKRAGIATLVLDHTGKDLERGARGASAKTDNIDFAFELLQRSRDLLTMRCTHARARDPLLDEPTYLRRSTSPLEHIVEHHASTADEPAVRPTHLMERVSRYVEANPGASKKTIETAVKGKTDFVRLALELLVLEAHIAAEPGPRNSTTHRLIKAYREDEDTPE